MEDRRARPHQRSREQNRLEIGCNRQRHQPDHGEPHANRERIGLGMLVGVKTHERLQERGRRLVGQGDKPDLSEREIESTLEQRIDRKDQRLHHVVQEVGKAQGTQHPEAGALCAGERCRLDTTYSGAHMKFAPDVPSGYRPRKGRGPACRVSGLCPWAAVRTLF